MGLGCCVGMCRCSGVGDVALSSEIELVVQCGMCSR